ncbi:SDR family oxidoreductase [Conyzicola nivalis]|uniref:NAD-dependent dehydratase n=1 Tax=Conyzicola nivalis TaxID=1477021 RepID=A0A916WIB2_9MICO|nr:NAD-dependent epimerase/dehydratase family protein [Conyzicola nivalis]GGB00301.1 NAD-dependent dehydratase [Conyzicola nivalis]
MTASPTHVVLGGNGVVGRETVRALLERGETPASFGRRPSTVDGAHPLIGDLLDRAHVSTAIRGAEVAYLTAGLPYSGRVWAEQWPVVVGNIVDAAIEHGTHLVYFDNVYAYGRVHGPMTEHTAIVPAGKKGRVRASALETLAEASDRGLIVTTVRSADFYGPGASTSVFNSFALDRIAKGKTATWLFDADQPHSLTHTPDIGDALALVGTVPEARGGTWHVPTAPALTGREYIELAGGRIGVMGGATMRVGSLFNSAARETLELAHQYTAPYIFDSTAFETAFGVTATPVARGIEATLAAARSTPERAQLAV